MKDKEIQHIICAVRGVPKSRDTVTKAIDLALEHNARLTFVHVTDLEFLTSASTSMTPMPSIEKQMNNLGEFAMLILCDRAERRGVSSVDFVVRQGKFFRQLRILLNEVQPDLLVIGRPYKPAASTRSIKPASLADFIKDIEENLNIPVVPVDLEIEA